MGENPTWIPGYLMWRAGGVVEHVLDLMYNHDPAELSEALLKCGC